MYLDIMGIEFELEVEFTVYSWGWPDSYWEPGDPAELEIDSVVSKVTGIDWRDYLETARDLDIKKHKNFRTGIESNAYGYGFDLTHDWRTGKPKLTFNKNRTLLEVLETEIHENLSEHEPQFDD
jgi:hypothetical protein